MTSSEGSIPFRVAGLRLATEAAPPSRDLPAQMPLPAAAELLGCTVEAVEKHLGVSPVEKLRAGVAEPLTISAESVRRLAARLAPRPNVDTTGLTARQELALARPPAEGDVWLTTTTAAVVRGVTQRTVRKRAELGTIPFVEHEGRRWYRRTDVEVLAAARAFGGASRPARVSA